jgi:C_GCAxxG_C_C family probable redox protein
MNKIENALLLFNGNYNCSQAVFASFSEVLGMEKEMALRIACGFGAGIARQQLICGAVTGAIMVISSKYGNYTEEDLVSKEKTYQLIHHFSEKFLEKHNSIECNKLVGCNFNTEEGIKYYSENEIQKKICAECIKDSIEILEEILREK